MSKLWLYGNEITVVWNRHVLQGILSHYGEMGTWLCKGKGSVSYDYDKTYLDLTCTLLKNCKNMCI